MWDLSPDRLEYPDSAKRFESSTMAFGCIKGLEKSIEYLTLIGIENICDHNMQLADMLIEGLNALDITIISPMEKRERSSIVTCKIDGIDAAEIVRKLKDRSVIIHKRQDYIRFAPHLYNSEEDIMRAINDLKIIIKS